MSFDVTNHPAKRTIGQTAGLVQFSPCSRAQTRKSMQTIDRRTAMSRFAEDIDRFGNHSAKCDKMEALQSDPAQDGRSM